MAPQRTEGPVETVPLDDGRRLAYAEFGQPDGRPIVWFHGTPSSRLDAVWLDDAARRTGWRLVAFDRPGHGQSSPLPSARIADIADDVAALADALGLDRFAVLGYSGGAAYTLATALVLGPRVEVVGLVSPWGPPDRPGAYQGVARSERLSDDLARRWPAVTRVLFTGLRWSLRWAPTMVARGLARRLEGDTQSGRAEGQPSAEAVVPIREALRQGAAGPTLDLHLIVCPWGFDPAEVSAPVRVWHGDEDPEIPMHHGRHLADVVADGQLEVIIGGDHLALYTVADHIFEVLSGVEGAPG